MGPCVVVADAKEGARAPAAVSYIVAAADRACFIVPDIYIDKTGYIISYARET